MKSDIYTRNGLVVVMPTHADEKQSVQGINAKTSRPPCAPLSTSNGGEF